MTLTLLVRRLAFLVCLPALLALAARLPAKPPAERAKLGERTVAFINAKPLPIKPDDDELTKLLKARVNVALAETQGLYERLQQGSGTLDRFYDASKRLFDARMELYQQP